MSNQNRFLLPHGSNATPSSTTVSAHPRAASSSASAAAAAAGQAQSSQGNSALDSTEQENNQHSVDTDFDSYWEEEARNPHRNRIRIGRQYQASVPPLLKLGEKDRRKLDELETLSFCPKKSAKVSDVELDHYFTVAKSLNLFASLVETRSLLGRDVTIADLNHIRNKEGLSLASVIQPVRQAAVAAAAASASAAHGNPIVSPLSSSQQSVNNQQQTTTTTSPTTTTSQSVNQQLSPQKSPFASCDRSLSSSSSSPKDSATSTYAFNQPFMKALSHFISLHHPCHHDRECKKLLKDTPLTDESGPAVSITAGNLRQGSSSSANTTPLKESKPGRSRSSLKQQAAAAQAVAKEEPSKDDQDEHQTSGDSVSSPSQDDWTREEVELFSKAIEVCGKNFSSIKKEFLPSKSVKSIVEYYYIGSRDSSESKKKSSQSVESGDGCSSPEKSLANNNSQGGGGNGGSSTGGKTSGTSSHLNNATSSSTTNSSSRTSNNSDPNNPTKSLSDSNQDMKQEDTPNKTKSNLKLENVSNGLKNKTKNIDARMSVYNFDEEFKDDSPIRIDCPRPGAEVKPLKAKPIVPNSAVDADPANSNVGSLKFFMDGQLVLKLNACQDQQEGVDKCHWVQSGDKMAAAGKQKRYPKKSDKSSADFNQNGSQSNSVVSSYQDDDSKNDDLTGDEDSKESMNSFTNMSQQQQQQQPQKNHQHKSPTPKRLKIKNEPNAQQVQLPSPIDYNRLAVNNRIKERSDNLNSNSAINQAMPWLQANSFAVAAALLGGLPFPQNQAANVMDTSPQPNVNMVNLASKPMDLSLEHSSPKTLQKPASRSRSRPKNN